MLLEVGIFKLNYHKVSGIGMSLRKDFPLFLVGGGGPMTNYIIIRKLRTFTQPCKHTIFLEQSLEETNADVNTIVDYWVCRRFDLNNLNNSFFVILD